MRKEEEDRGEGGRGTREGWERQKRDGRTDDESEGTACGDKMTNISLMCIHASEWVWPTFASGRGEVEAEESP